MTQIDYLYYQVATGWSNIRGTFRTWVNLMTSNYKDYALLHDDDPFTECLEWFWYDLNGDELYSKEFLEYLYQLAEDVETGKVKTIPMDLEQLKRISDLLDDVELCEDM